MPSRKTDQTIDGIMTSTMRIACAEPTDENLGAVLDLIEDARGWLWTKDTDQWEKPWPSREARDARVLKGLQRGATWIVWDDSIPAATVTMTPRKNAAVWSKPTCTCDLAERAVFVHRLITARKYAGTGLGTELIDWAGSRGQRLYGARWIRIDVWSTNQRLHDYYVKRGFEPCGFCADPSYPSGALFQKPVSAITKPSSPQFMEFPEQLGVDHQSGPASCSPPR
jgi:GNAT superfamily N-acetyltransferase